ncbi:TPA: hypothetical protein R4X03_004061 [Enterobacter hormaechei subsp. xiangfangensis]|uniref:hypothetical protein n=1 Tax=Enterobacter hormaechei TaxID=158836 RepID=UPI0013D068F7|nr:hypothetical protein [Enterobacter hormaechei]HCT3244896.1 hypothetical protein [Enterobacter hormaechei]HED1729155.1 hypothetical protein [Enterobacter hormaechei subsp. xiangfangensis]
MTKSLAQIRAEHQYIDKEGVTRDRTLNIPHYFKEIPFIYSPLLEKGRVKFSARMQKLYCYVADWEKSGGVCYEEQSELAKVCDLTRPKTNDLIELMESIGLLSVSKIEGRRNLELRALPLTDAHITPPEALTVQPDIIFDVVTHQAAPEPATTEETQDDAPNWDESAPPDNVQEKSEPLGLPEMITDEMKIDAVCELLSKTESLRQQSRGDTFINYARRVLHRKSMKLPSRFEEKLEMRFEHRYPHFYGRFGTPF